MERTEFMRAVETYRDTVYRVALHHFASPPDAEDAVQEVFLRLYTREEAFDSQEHLRRWLIRVTVNVCKDVLKSPWRRRRISLEALPDQPVFDAPEQGELYQAVLALPEKYRVVLDLYYYEELSTREIGQVLGLRQTAVTTRLFRARDLLKQRLEAWQDDE
jgi:RNA polymerase sigma factor (sigma-70 family)